MLAQAVADGASVDWADAEAGARDPAERDAIRNLRIVSGIVQVHRGASDEDPATPNAMPDSWGHLKILGCVGRGVFGTVYRALDPHLDREVALKLLHGNADFDEGRMSARIRHPNVVTVFGADIIDGQVGVWMEFVNGRTLLDIQREQGPFSAQEAALIGLNVCSALSAVHKAGFLHRDIKAQNVMREAGGRIVLMDFGAGEQLRRPPGISELKGTPLYLAPELLDGREATAVSDIYAVGVLLYYLVTGAYPYEAADLNSLRAKHHERAAARLQDVRPELPDGFARVVECALHPDRKRRFSSAGAMQFALAEVLGLRFGGESLVDSSSSSAGVRSDADQTPSVAVLPFSDLSPDKDQAYLCEGIAEELINALSALTRVRVAARSSSFRFAGSAVDVRQVGEQLNVQAVLEGSVRKAGSRLRITAQLVNARDGYHLWSERYDRDLDDVFAVQDEIARAIVSKLKIRQHEDSYQPFIRRHTEDLEAYNLYLQGRYYWSRRYAGGLERAIEYFSKTIAHDPSYALAHAGIAESFCLLGVYDALPPHVAIAKAKPAAQRAAALDDSLSEAHQAMALVHWYFDWDYDAALREYRLALELNPTSAISRALFGVLLADLGRFDESRAEIRLAIDREPVSALISFYVASTLAITGPLDDALPECERMMDLDPTFLPGHWSYGNILSYLGRHDEAIALADRALTLSHRQSFFLAFAGRLYASAGRIAESDAIVAELRARAPQAYVSPLGFAEIAIAAGRFDEAFSWLDRAYKERSPFLVALGVAPFYDAVRGDPRFMTMLERLGLGDVRPPRRRP